MSALAALLEHSSEECTASQTARALHGSRLLFGGLVAYLLAQAYAIPIAAIGPSWAVWPSLPDIAVVALAVALVLTGRVPYRRSDANRRLLRLIIVGVAGCALSFGVVNLGFRAVGLRIGDDTANPGFGLFGLYRLAQFALVFAAASRVTLDAKRRSILRQVSCAVLLWVCATIALTYFWPAPGPLFGAHLPRGIGVAGPWFYYLNPFGARGLGTVGYNHAFVAINIVALLGLWLHLSGKPRVWVAGAVMLVCIVATFLTGSRAGLAAIVLCVLVMTIRRPAYIVPLAALSLTLVVAAASALATRSDWAALVGNMFERQQTLTQSYDNDTLSGRPEIWAERLQFVCDEPARWLIGSGFGSAAESGQNAHMLPLQIILEMGVVGLAGFAVLGWLVMTYLWRREPPPRAFMWATAALILSSATQETFYPTPASGHFIGLYLCALALCLSGQRSPQGERLGGLKTTPTVGAAVPPH